MFFHVGIYLDSTTSKTLPRVASSSASISKRKEKSKPPSKRKKPVTKLTSN